MKEEILLSIIIPTYNRYEYLIESLDVMADTIESRQVEIVVQDNTVDNTAIVDYLKKKNDERIKYFHVSERLTVSENSSRAILNSKGKFLIFIGDDDAVCNTIMDVVKYMNDYDIDACTFKSVVYHWPDLIEKVSSLDTFISPQISEHIEVCNSKLILREEIKNGLQSLFDFPRVYHAIITRNVLDKLMDKTGTFFPGPSPDMANAAPCCFFAKKQIKIQIPLMISGYSLASGGGLGRQRKHTGSLKGKDWLPKDVEEKWDQKIPLLWLQCTIWPASAVEALRRVGEDSVLKNLNYGIIYGETIIQTKQRGIIPVLKCKPTIKEIFVMIKYIIGRIVEKLTRKPTDDIVNNEIITLRDATTYQNKLNDSVNISEAFTKLNLTNVNQQ